MRVRFALSFALLIALMLTAPGLSHAEDQVTAPLLVPSGELDAIRGRMLNLQSRLVCDDTGCRWNIEQHWIIENTDKTQDRALVLSLGYASDMAHPELIDAQDNVLTPQQSDLGLQWSLVVRANKRADLTLRYTMGMQSSYFCQWSLKGDELNAWSGPDSLRIRMISPALFREDLVVSVAPSHYQLVGNELVWDYENTQTYPDHELAMLSPSTCELIDDYHAAGEYLAYVELLRNLGRAAAALDLRWPDAEAEIAAALQMAVATDPQDTAAQWALANHYLDQREKQPGRAHNYLALAAGALASAVSENPSDSQARQLLNNLYMQASREASQSGDLAGALEYIQLAEANGAGSLSVEEDHHLLALQWSVALAKQGQPTEALARVGDSLSPAAQEDIEHYAPPFAAAETRISYGPRAISAVTRLQAYGPTAEKTFAGLKHMADTISRLDGWSASLSQEATTCIIAVTLDTSDPIDAKAARAALLLAIQDDANILACLLTLPWIGEGADYHYAETLWQNQLTFAHTLDTRALSTLYDKQADYAGWRLAEIRAREAQTAVDELEQELVMAALDEQVTIWRQLPASCYWVTEVDTGNLSPTRPALNIVGWDQARSLDLYATEYRWGTIAATAGAVLALLALLGIAALWGHRPSHDR